MGTYYAAIGNNKENMKKSLSGGIFFVLAKNIIKQGGVVCGAAFDENLKLKHMIVDSVPELENLQGSKYVQSEMGEILESIAIILKSEKSSVFRSTVPNQWIVCFLTTSENSI